MAGLRLTIDPTQLEAGAARAENALERVQREAADTEAALIRTGRQGGQALGVAGTAAVAAGQSFSVMGGGARMLTQQLSQVVQQASATGNIVQALAVQAPDIGLAFGAVGTAVGVLAAVALPALISAFGQTAEEARTVEDAMSDLQDISDGLADAQDILNMSVLELVGQYGAYALAVRNTAEELQRLQIAQAQAALAEQVELAGDALAQFTGRAATAFTSGIRMADAMANIASELGVTGAQAQELQSIFSDLRNAASFEDRIVAFQELSRALEAAGVDASLLPEPIRLAMIEAGELSIQMAEVAAQADSATTAASNLGGVSLGGLFGQITSVSGALDAVIARFRAAWTAATRTTAPTAPGRPRARPTDIDFGYSGPPTFNGPSPPNRPMDLGLPDLPSGGGGGGGGGGGVSAVERAAQEYDNLLRSLDPVARASGDLADAQETINAALSAGAINAEEAARAYGLAEQRFTDATDRLREGSDAWNDFAQAGGSAIDRLISGSLSLKEALGQIVIEFLKIRAQQRLMQSVAGAQSGDSLGTLIFRGLAGGFQGMFDSGGTIGRGGWGIVGERGPELVAATSGGAVVTSRARTAQMGGTVRVEGGDLTLTDDGRIMARVRVMAAAAGQQAVQAVKAGLPGWQTQYGQDGVIA